MSKRTKHLLNDILASLTLLAVWAYLIYHFLL